jgi:hypothetical protein
LHPETQNFWPSGQEPDADPPVPDAEPPLPGEEPPLPDVEPPLPDVEPPLPDVEPPLPEVDPVLSPDEPHAKSATSETTIGKRRIWFLSMAGTRATSGAGHLTTVVERHARVRYDARVIRRHWIAAVLCCAVLPAASWLDGTGSFAWTMFSKSETYRIRIDVTLSDGRHMLVNPTALTAYASVDLAGYLSGAESWRHGPVGRNLRHDLRGLCHLSCRLPSRPSRADIEIETRVDLDAPIVASRTGCSCVTAE